MSNGTWEGKRGESVFISDDPTVKPYLEEAGIDGIEYKNGMTDFTPVSKGQVDINGMSTYRPDNYDLADIELAKKWSTPDDVWTAKDVKNDGSIITIHGMKEIMVSRWI